MTVPAWFTPWLLAVDALAVFRVTRFITDDHLPFGPVRDWIQNRYPGSLIGEWVECPWCAGMWVSSAVLTAHAVAPRWWPYPAVVLAFSAVTGLFATWENHK